MPVPILALPVRRWHCPACGLRDETREARPHTRMHTCPKLRSLTVPMLPAGVAGKLELHEREDYIGREAVQLDPERRRPVMNVVTTRDEGQDCTVYAPTATGRIAP
jgi:hypothetical protein